MNQKKMKLINLHAKVLLVQWLSGLVDAQESGKATPENIRSLLPDQTHIFIKNQLRLSAFTFKWTVKALKRLVYQDPTRDIHTFTLEEVTEQGNKHQRSHAY